MGPWSGFSICSSWLRSKGHPLNPTFPRHVLSLWDALAEAWGLHGCIGLVSAQAEALDGRRQAETPHRPLYNTMAHAKWEENTDAVEPRGGHWPRLRVVRKIPWGEHHLHGPWRKVADHCKHECDGCFKDPKGCIGTSLVVQ